MVPNIEEIRSELDFLVLRYGEVFDQGGVPILLERSPILIATKRAEAGGCPVISDDRCGREGAGVEVGLLAIAAKAGADAPRSQSASKRGAGRETCCGVRNGRQGVKRGSRAGIDDGKGQTRLEDGHTGKAPPTQHFALPAFCLREERQVVQIADDQPMRSIEIGKAAGTAQIELIIKYGVEGSVVAGGGVCRTRESISGLYVTVRPASGEGRLHPIVVPVGIIGKLFKGAVSVHAQGFGANNGICQRVRGDLYSLTVRQCDRERLCGADQDRLQGVRHLAKGNGMASHLTDIQPPIMGERSLNGKVPLLDTGNSEVPWYLQRE